MKHQKQLLFLLWLAAPVFLWAQNKPHFSISGSVKDKASGETLPGAAISLLELPQVIVAANSYGFYSLTIPEGTYNLITSYTGYAADTIPVVVNKNMLIDIRMLTGQSSLQAVTVKSNSSRNNNILTTPAGVQKLTVESIKNVPVLLGEKDILKTIQLLPGVVSAGDGKSGFYVRGGGVDQNLILLDEATVYNASHALGFFSVFNSDAIKDISVYKGGMPANYGGRLSSVEDIQMKDGNNQKIGVSGGLGLIASRLTVEGPLLKKKGSFIVSARRTYADIFTGLSSDTTIKGSKLYFYDVNLKGNYIINDNNRIFLSGYFGKDVTSFKNSDGIDYGNATATLRWNHIFSRKLFSNTSLIYSNFIYNVHFYSNTNDVKVSSGVRDYHFKQNFNYYLNATNKIDIGLEATSHLTQPGTAQSAQSSSYNNIVLQKKHSLESAVYISHEWTATSKLKLVYGLRVSALTVMGSGTFYTYDSAGKINSSHYYGSGKMVKTYINPEPRLSAIYKLNPMSSIKLAYDRNVQNIHLLNNVTSVAPTSVYLPSTNNVKPEIADQFSIGYYRDFSEHKYELSSELYYKNLQNQLDYKNSANLVGNENVEADLLSGKGRAYGWETFLKKKTGKLNGWISYTLSRTERKISGINNGSYYPAYQDQPHHLSVVALYEASKKWTLSAAFIYNTGNAVTWPTQKFSVDGAAVYYYGDRNSNRLPAYHRLDIGATLQGRKTAKFESSWNFSIYNVYGKANPYTIVFQKDPANPEKTQVLQTTLFKIIPSVTYNFKF